MAHKQASGWRLFIAGMFLLALPTTGQAESATTHAANFRLTHVSDSVMYREYLRRIRVFRIPPPDLARYHPLDGEREDPEADPSPQRAPDGGGWSAAVVPDGETLFQPQVLVYRHPEHYLMIDLSSMLDPDRAPTVQWVGEKLLFIRAWWDKALGTDVIVDIERGEIIYRGMFAWREAESVPEEYRDPTGFDPGDTAHQALLRVFNALAVRGYVLRQPVITGRQRFRAPSATMTFNLISPAGEGIPVELVYFSNADGETAARQYSRGCSGANTRNGRFVLLHYIGVSEPGENLRWRLIREFAGLTW